MPVRGAHVFIRAVRPGFDEIRKVLVVRCGEPGESEPGWAGSRRVPRGSFMGTLLLVNNDCR